MSQSFSLQVVWQAGVAATLGFLLDKKSPSEEVESRASSANAREPKANLSLARKTTFACLFALLAWFVARAVTINYAAAERQRKIEDAMKSPPSLEGLPEIQMVPVDDKIVLKEIDGFGPVLPFSRRMAGSPQFGQYSGEPPTTIYSVRYYNGQPATLLEPDPGLAVTITQYPNAQWVNYRLKDVPVPNASVMYAKYIQRVTKFENAILEDTGWRYPDGHGDLYFYWPSQNDLVVVVFGTRQVDEEFLRVYLKRAKIKRPAASPPAVSNDPALAVRVTGLVRVHDSRRGCLHRETRGSHARRYRGSRDCRENCHWRGNGRRRGTIGFRR